MLRSWCLFTAIGTLRQAPNPHFRKLVCRRHLTLLEYLLCSVHRTSTVNCSHPRAQEDWGCYSCFSEEKAGLLSANYGGLNGSGPYRLIRSSTIRKCGLVRLCLVLVEEVCHSLILLPLDQDTFPVPCLPACCHTFCHADSRLNLNCKPAAIKCFTL